MSIDDWTPQGYIPDVSDSGPLPPNEREALREQIEYSKRPAQWTVEDMFAEPDMEMLRFNPVRNEWVSAGYGVLRIRKHKDSTFVRLYVRSRLFSSLAFSRHFRFEGLTASYVEIDFV